MNEYKAPHLKASPSLSGSFPEISALTRHSSRREVAHAWHDDGFSVVPTHSKHPSVRWKAYQSRMPTHHQNRYWWSRLDPFANVALVCGLMNGIVTADVDRHNGGLTSFAALEARIGPLPETVKVRTPRGGFHLYFRHPGGRLPSLNDAFGRGIDFKADGGIVLVPGSIGPGETRYTFARGAALGQVDVADLPAELLAELPTPTTWQETCDQSSEEQAEFIALWARLGIVVEEGDQVYRCCFHDDVNPSLSINSETCVFRCFGCNKKGNLATLRTLTGVRKSANFSLPTHLAREEFATDETVQCGTTALLGDRTGRGLLVGLHCKRRTCARCGPRIRQEQTEHFLTHLLGCKATVFVTVIPHDKWRSVHGSIKRRNGHYLRIPKSEDEFVVFTTVGLDTEMGWRPVEADELVLEVARAVSAIPTGVGNVSSDRAWAEPQKSSDLTVVARPAMSARQAAKELENVGIRPTRLRAGGFSSAVAIAYSAALPAPGSEDEDRMLYALGAATVRSADSSVSRGRL